MSCTSTDCTKATPRVYDGNERGGETTDGRGGECEGYGVCWNELQYCSLASQTCIYGLTEILSSGENKLLVSCLQAKVISVSLQNRLPTTQELAFTYIASNAEIVSIDAYNRIESTDSPGVVVAIAFIKPLEGEHEKHNYLNVYCEWEKGFEADMDRVSEGCQSLALNFVPYQLYHTQVCRGSSANRETVFLLSGSDQKIHLFREATNTHMFVKDEVGEYIPEMADLPSVVIRMQCVYKDGCRITVLGCQNGQVLLTITNLTTAAVRSYNVQHDSPISSVSLFHSSAKSLPAPDYLKQEQKPLLSEPDSGENELHLLVCGTLEPAVVYSHVSTRGLTELSLLADSDSADCVMCSVVADIDFDGLNEIVLGTYGQELLIYKLQTPRPNHLSDNSPPYQQTTKGSQPIPSQSARVFPRVSGRTHPSKTASETLQQSAALPSSTGQLSYNSGRLLGLGLESDSTGVACTADEEKTGSVGGAKSREFVMIGRRSMPDPVLGLAYVDLTMDGLKELIVLSLNGLHVLQHDLHGVARLLQHRLENLLSTTDRTTTDNNRHLTDSVVSQKHSAYPTGLFESTENLDQGLHVNNRCYSGTVEHKSDLTAEQTVADSETHSCVRTALVQGSTEEIIGESDTADFKDNKCEQAFIFP